ncbi:MAG TPA: hypothetical protein PLW34_03340 [Termitinemataceae bacterium]|nr:hypothetical protein [Termitinemataceae bacterium]HOM22734.1 hypothetical protein [Termitinemataceae bacterium]HPQ00850.1 hypothetical protein [Termitinemataceae bacterium]
MTKGLLERAQDKMEEESLVAGISPEDQREIRAQIEALTRREGLESKNIIPFKPQKRGFLFPLIINIFLLGGTILLLWTLSRFFSQEDIQQTTYRAQIYTAEGKLIQQIKQEAEQKLLQKAQEIAQIQNQLSRLEEENRKMMASFDERLKAKEEEIRKKIQEEVAAERIRLEAQGLAEAIIAERLKKFEAERQAYYAKQLEQFKQQLAREKAEAEATYNQLRTEYLRNIQTLQAERQRIQQESAQREQKLRANLEEKNRELAAITAQITIGEARFEQARAELARLSEQQRLRSSVEAQISGFYQTIQRNYQQGRYEEALSQISRCIAYLNNNETILNLPEFQRRREMDLFAMETIGNFIRIQIEKTSNIQTDLLKQVELLSLAQKAVAQARQALDRGAPQEARQAYLQALNTLPELLESHQYILSQQQQEEQQKLVNAMRQLGEGHQARKEGNYEGAASAYARALTLLGIPEKDTSLLIEGLVGLGAERWQQQQIREDSRLSAPLIREAQRFMRQENWTEALRSYTQVLAKYPATQEQPRILTDIDTILLNLGKKQEVAVEDLQRKIEEVQKQAADLRKALEEEKSLSTQKDRDLETQKRRVAELEKALELARTQTQQALNTAAGNQGNAATAGTSAGPAVPGAEALAASPEYTALKQENERLKTALQEYERLSAAYRTYRTREDTLLARGGANSLVEARGSLEAFLNDPAIRQVFPDLRERILRYEKEFVTAGQKESLYLAREIVETVLRLQDERSRNRYIEGLQSRYQDNEAMRSFLESLKKNLGT